MPRESFIHEWLTRLEQQLERLTAREARRRVPQCGRLAKTWSSSVGTYPADPANTYDLVFLDGEFTETPGDQTATYTDRSASTQSVGHNLIDGEYIARGTTVIAYKINGQYWFERCA